MAEESERRFEAIMNKLFHAPPKSRPNPNDTSRQGVQQLSGRKRLRSSSEWRKVAGNVLGESGSSLSGSPASAQAPLCRPWDRGDLFRRLSTFKSMTWFAKPQVVSPLECARRGWVNVDVDTIACASCDSRLLFSTPSVWTQQQVEKAAMVFSLKLESGHKLLCPWINNACAEELAHFPILSRTSLIEDYKKRFFSLSQLIALPVIVSVAIDNLITQLEQFLRESSTSGCDELLEKSGTELPGHVPKSVSSVLYYQAQKLISLFGWEPRLLPYRVDFKDGQNHSVKDANVLVTIGLKPILNIYSSCTSEGTNPSSELQFDPSSVVLDCKLCGASVGLWAFSTIPRPLEYLRFVGLTEVTGKNIAIHDEVGAQEGSPGNQIRTGSREGITNTGTTASTSSGFTIAGGPPPAMLNYGATISLPIVGQNLRARLPIKTGIKDLLAIQKTSQVEDQPMLRESENVSAEETLATMCPVNSGVADHPRFGAEEFSCSTPEDNTAIRKGGAIEPDREQMAENHEEVGRYQSYCLDNPGIGPSTNHKRVPFSIRENKKPLSLDKPMEFDPIKQHRHFCPWIMSTGKFAPGWQQTLSALEGNKEINNVHLSTLIEVDDPVDSVKKLFATPDEKGTEVRGQS